VLTGDSFFHLSAYGEALPGLNLCGAGRVVCLIDPVGDVYACPFAIHENFLAGNVRSPGGFPEVWQHSDLFLELRQPQTGGACQSCMHYDSCQGGCMAAKFFTGLPLDGPDPECVRGFGERALAARDGALELPKSDVDHSRSAPRNFRGGRYRSRSGWAARQGLRDQPTGRAGRRRERLAPAQHVSVPRGDVQAGESMIDSVRPCQLTIARGPFARVIGARDEPCSDPPFPAATQGAVS
jgi:radical SAM protein with 4Fe4S-binding SPASM domain